MPNPSELERQRQYAAEGEGEVVENAPIKTLSVADLREINDKLRSMIQIVREVTGIIDAQRG